MLSGYELLDFTFDNEVLSLEYNSIIFLTRIKVLRVIVLRVIVLRVTKVLSINLSINLALISLSCRSVNLWTMIKVS